MKIENLEHWKFFDNQQESDIMFSLVCDGIKTATSWLYDGNLERQGFSVLSNWDGSKKVLLQESEIKVLKFCDVTQDMAYKEGEGDRTLKYWQRVHEEFYRERCKEKGESFSPEILICFQEFKVIEFIEDRNGRKTI